VLPWLTSVLAGGHLAFVIAAGSLRWEHAVADLLLVALTWAPLRTQAYARAGLALWLTGILLDNQPYFIDALRGNVHTGDLWSLEARLFPAWVDGVQSVWAAHFMRYPSTLLDAVCGFAYAIYLPQFFGILVALFALKSPRAERMAWTFFVVNALGVLVYILYPAAPPWYVMTHGPGPADLAARGNAAGAARFDALLGIRFFEGFYARNPNPFGAMPSLHTAYPTAALWQVWHRGVRWQLPAALFALLIGFSAVYLSHHYILDVLAGAAVAGIACAAVDGTVRARTKNGAALGSVGAPVAVLTGEGSRHD